MLNSSSFISLIQLSWSKSLWRSSGQGSVVLLTTISNSLLYNSLWDRNKRIGSAFLWQVRLHFTRGITAFHFLSLERFREVPHQHNDAPFFLVYDLSHTQGADSQLLNVSRTFKVHWDTRAKVQDNKWSWHWQNYEAVIVSDKTTLRRKKRHAFSESTIKWCRS